ncbi:MAG: DUF1552 domain-containing protein [Polyangiaceae bacterium]
MMNHVNRRIFLRGLGGALVAAPFLSSIAERSAKGQSTTAVAPRRLILMFTHYGCITTRFFPTKSHGALAASDLQSTTLKYLAPYVDKLLLPRGIRGMNEWTAGMSRGQGNDPHTQVVGSYLTCQPVTPNSNDPFSFDQATKFNAKPIGPSLDHVIAKAIGADGSPLLMRVGNRGESPLSAISYSASETNFPGLGQPSQIYSQLTGLFKTGTAMTPDTYQAIRGKSVIDLVKDDLSTLERVDMSASDKQKLAAWKELLNQTTQVIVSNQCNADVANAIGASKANIDAVKLAGGSSDTLTSKVTDALDAADIYSNLAVLAAVCNANPVIVLKYPGSYVYSGLGLNLEAHSLSHRIGDAGMTGTCLNGVIDMLLKIDDYHAKKFAHLVEMLNSITEGDKKLLDNTAAVWMQEMSDGNAHNLNNLPIVQAGGCGGYFKTGWTVNVEDGNAALSVGRSESACTNGTTTNVNGTTQSTGTEATKANAPINKYYVNLMNALGVKAGADGYAVKGGSADVTKFGMYDKTEDFIGGGTKPTRDQ